MVRSLLPFAGGKVSKWSMLLGAMMIWPTHATPGRFHVLTWFLLILFTHGDESTAQRALRDGRPSAPADTPSSRHGVLDDALKREEITPGW